jgi:hypothetical protein
MAVVRISDVAVTLLYVLESDMQPFAQQILRRNVKQQFASTENHAQLSV